MVLMGAISYADEISHSNCSFKIDLPGNLSNANVTYPSENSDFELDLLWLAQDERGIQGMQFLRMVSAKCTAQHHEKDILAILGTPKRCEEHMALVGIKDGYTEYTFCEYGFAKDHFFQISSIDPFFEDQLVYVGYFVSGIDAMIVQVHGV